MNKVFKSILSVVVVGVAYFIGYFIVQYGIHEYRKVAVEAGVDDAIDQLNKEVEKDTSDRTESDKVFDASQNLVSKKLEGTKDGKVSQKDLQNNKRQRILQF